MENRIEFSYWYKQGEKAFEDRDYASAVKYFTDAINKDPNHVYAVGVRGIAYYHLRRYKEALKDLDKALISNQIMLSLTASKGALIIILKSMKQHLTILKKRAICI